MDTQAIFGLQFLMSVVVIGMLAKWKVAPWLRTIPQREGLFWLTVPHAFRHVGMVFLVPGVVAQSVEQIQRADSVEYPDQWHSSRRTSLQQDERHHCQQAGRQITVGCGIGEGGGQWLRHNSRNEEHHAHMTKCVRHRQPEHPLSLGYGP